ncbi:nucleoside-diphosphate kinase [Candidatus Nomurabacteria bacterium]|jgi:nucleoside-diphosphate kinase|nr:nucleoside-diphosphate kinase [Candidatus Saccharibacteria bacterium]MCA9313200.1 nucleoside-diphosphate kinase [Candidatus Saccharibacteria bacterium]MCB9822202.1 nucleoside-diphosphate kinase [Candidatus Nomurabacteria bacterium]MDQ5969969.1 nucleoside-diphosphate kinase [Patescibacteria group bacterium]
MERTLIILKPDTIQRGIIGEIITRFERAGLKIVAMKMIAPDELHFHKHYEGISGLISRWGEDIYNVTLKQMTETPVIVFVLEGIEAVSHVRKMVGATDPKDSAPGTIRGDYTHITRGYTNPIGATLPNIVHASGNVEEANQEIELWFKQDEIYGEYDTAQGPVVRGKVVLKKK